MSLACPEFIEGSDGARQKRPWWPFLTREDPRATLPGEKSGLGQGAGIITKLSLSVHSVRVASLTCNGIGKLLRYGSQHVSRAYCASGASELACVARMETT